MKAFVIVLCLFATQITTSVEELIIELSQHSRFKGPVDRHNIQGSCHNIIALRGDVSGVKLLSGSCVVLYDQHDCTGREFFVSYLHSREVNLVGTDFNDKASSASACHTRQFHAQCPEGTYVKSIYDDTPNRRGVNLECYTPSQIEVKVLSTHGYKSTGKRDECKGALRGIQFSRDNNLNAVVHMAASCTAKPNLSNFVKEHCGKGQAVCGLNTTIESNTELMKSANVICCDVPDPASLCRPSDEYNVLSVLDNLNALSPTTFKYTKTVGVTISNKTGEIGSREENFYGEFGFSAQASGAVLSANFQNSLGYSKTTRLEWSAESDQTWNEETTTTVELEVPAGVRATLFQVIGTCSFYKIYSSTVRREDFPKAGRKDNSSKTNTTEDDRFTISPMPKPEDLTAAPWYEMYRWEIISVGVVFTVIMISFIAYKLKMCVFGDKYSNVSAVECEDPRFENAAGNNHPRMFSKSHA